MSTDTSPARRGVACRRVLLSALATTAFLPATVLAVSNAELAAMIRYRGLEPDEVVVPFAIDAEMEEWARTSVRRATRPDERLKNLLTALLDSEQLQLEYVQSATGTAQDAFRTGKANCLAFTQMFVGLARSLGVEVYFMRADDLRGADQDGDLIVLEGHITTGFGPAHNRLVLDFASLPIDDWRRLRPISDLTAIALYYSNRGAELVRKGAHQEALEWFEIAIQLDPELADAWVNLGVAQRRLGDITLAEESYKRALEINPRTLTAYHNLAAIMQLAGKPDEAFELLALTDKLTNRDPFNFLALGDMSLRRDHLADAERYYKRAIRMAPDEASPYAALGQLMLAQGERGKAKRYLKKASKRDEANGRVAMLDRALHGRAQPADSSGVLPRTLIDSP